MTTRHNWFLGQDDVSTLIQRILLSCNSKQYFESTTSVGDISFFIFVEILQLFGELFGIPRYSTLNNAITELKLWRFRMENSFTSYSWSIFSAFDILRGKIQCVTSSANSKPLDKGSIEALLSLSASNRLTYNANDIYYDDSLTLLNFRWLWMMVVSMEYDRTNERRHFSSEDKDDDKFGTFFQSSSIFDTQDTPTKMEVFRTSELILRVISGLVYSMRQFRRWTSWY